MIGCWFGCIATLHALLLPLHCGFIVTIALWTLYHCYYCDVTWRCIVIYIWLMLFHCYGLWPGLIYLLLLVVVLFTFILRITFSYLLLCTFPIVTLLYTLDSYVIYCIGCDYCYVIVLCIVIIVAYCGLVTPLLLFLYCVFVDVIVCYSYCYCDCYCYSLWLWLQIIVAIDCICDWWLIYV